MLAAELTLAGIDVVYVERRASQALHGSRAGGLHSRTIEVLDQRGVADRFVSAGKTHPSVGYAQTRLDISDFPTRHNYLLGLWQSDIERILAGWVEELGVAVLRSREVAGFTQDDAGVDVVLADGSSLRAGFLVGCDGGRSVVRKAAKIEFAGWDATTSWMIAEVEMTEEPELGVRPEGGGIGPVNREIGGSPDGVVLREQQAEHAAEPTLNDLRAALTAIYGTDYGAQPDPDLALRRHDPPGSVLPEGPCAAGRGRRACTSATGRTGAERWGAGCGEPRLETGPGGQGNITRKPARHVSRRAASGRCASVAQHHGPGGTGDTR